MSVPWQRLTVAVSGNGAAFLAVIFGVVALLVRRKAWPLGFLTIVASFSACWLLVPQLRPSIVGTLGQVRQSAGASQEQDREGISEAQAAITQHKSADTTATVAPLLLAWGEEAMVKPYEEHGRHNEKWDETARKFIQGMAQELSGKYPRPGLERLRPLMAELQRVKCDDPWVLFLIRRLNDDDPDFADMMHGSVANLSEAGYGAFPLWLARAEAVRADRQDGTVPKGQLDPACLEALRDALSAKPPTKGDLEAWLNIFRMEPGESILKQDADGVCKTIESITGMPGWFPLAVRGHAEIDLAWEARGTGWANSVGPAQWREFERHLQLARAALEQSCKLSPDEPDPAATLMTVELGSGGIEEMRQQFDTVLARRFDYIPAYDTLRQGLLPRWHGSEEAVLSFGRNCLATQRFDTGVPWQMLRAVYSIADDQDDEGDYYAHRAPWKDLDAMFAGYLAHGDPARRNYYLSTKLIMAAKAGMDDKVAELLKEVNYEIDPQAKVEWNLSLDYTGRMAALSGPAADAVLASSRFWDKLPPRSLEKIREAQKTSGLPPAAVGYIDRQASELEAIVSLGKVKWQPFTPDEQMAGWKAGSGQWKVVSPGALEVATDEAGAMLTRLAPAGSTWEMRGELLLAPSKTGRAEAAIFCGPADDQKEHGFSLRFWRRANGSSGISLARGLNDEALSKGPKLKETVPFFIRLENGHLRVKIADDQWFAEQPLPQGVNIGPDALLGLGSTGGGKQTVQFRKLEWRVPEPPAK